MKKQAKRNILKLIVLLVILAGIVMWQVYTYKVWKKNNPMGNYWEYVITRGG